MLTIIYQPVHIKQLIMNKKASSTLEVMEKTLSRRNYSPQTIKSYVYYVGKFLNNFDKDAYHISIKDAKKYIEDYNYSSVSQQNQIINAIKFLYKEVIGSKLRDLKIVRPRKEKKLPKVIDKDFLIKKIEAIGNIKHRAIIQLAFSTGCRVSEVINLKIKDVDSERMVINILNAKGRKDRQVPLSVGTLRILRQYFKAYRPSEYMFEGQSGDKYSATSCNKIVKKYISNDCHFHLLRHSAFTSMVEGGTDISVIQKIAGHNSPKTSSIYLHMTKTLMNKVATPM